MQTEPNGYLAIPAGVLTPLLGLPIRGQSLGGGTGEPNDPCLIYTAEQMDQIGQYPRTWASHFKRMANIDLRGYGDDGFHLIGTLYSPLSGVFDGGRHTVSGFTCISSDRENLGLFVAIGGHEGYWGATIKNLGLVDPCIGGTAALEAAGLTAIVFRVTVANCCVRGGRVEGGNNAGGLVGSNAIGQIVGCYANAAVRVTSD